LRSRQGLLRSLLTLTPAWVIWCIGNTPKIMVEYGWGQEHIKDVRSPKRCKLGPIGSRIRAYELSIAIEIIHLG